MGLLVLGFSLAACPGPERPKTAQVTAGPMPEAEEWTGVYFSQTFGHLHLVETDGNIVGRWRREDRSKWGEMDGRRIGNLFRYSWKEHTYGMIGPNSTISGHGYFVYTKSGDGVGQLRGEYGLGPDEVGSPWNGLKQLHTKPDLSSISGDLGGVAPPTGEKWQ